MGILDNAIILTLIIAAFVAGYRLAVRNNEKAETEKREALQRQFVRLRTNSDADDPCKPYYTPTRLDLNRAAARATDMYGRQQWYPVNGAHVVPNTGDFDGDGPINQQFMDQLKTTGQAKTTFKKSDLMK